MSENSVDLGGMVAVVTGGGRGLGKTMAEHLAAAGATVALVGRTPETLNETANAIRQTGGRAMIYPADITNRAAIEKMPQAVERELGPIDILVNNASIANVYGPLWESDPDAWWEVFNINVRGTFLCTHTVLQGMIERRRGRIIMVSSAVSFGVNPHFTSYYGSKMVQIEMAESLAEEAKEYGITAFSINPGGVVTDMTRPMAFTEEGQRWLPYVKWAFENKLDVSPEVSARLVTLLASGFADSLSGHYFSIEDDIADLVRRADEISKSDLRKLRMRT